MTQACVLLICSLSLALIGFAAITSRKGKSLCWRTKNRSKMAVKLVIPEVETLYQKQRHIARWWFLVWERCRKLAKEAFKKRNFFEDFIKFQEYWNERISRKFVLYYLFTEPTLVAYSFDCKIYFFSYCEREKLICYKIFVHYWLRSVI